MYKTILFLIGLFSSMTIISQTVSTVTQGSFTDALALDSQGNLYCSDWGGKTVYKYSSSGVVSIFKNGFKNPNGIGINAADEIYICDHTEDRIHKYDINGNETAVYNGLFITPAGIKNIPNTTDMLVVEYGNNFTATSTNSKIKKLAADGTVTTLFTGLPLNGPAGIAFINNIPYIANFNDRKIFKFENGTLTQIAQLQSEGPSTLDFLGFMSAIDNQLIATHIGGNKIYKIDPNSGIITLFSGSASGSADGDIATATFRSPNGILGDDANNRIYVSDSHFKNLRIINNAILSVGDEELLKIEVNVYPNPTKDSLNIKISNLENTSITVNVYDMNGREVFKKRFKNINRNFTSEIATINWSRGAYVLKIKDGVKIISKKIIL